MSLAALLFVGCLKGPTSAETTISGPYAIPMRAADTDRDGITELYVGDYGGGLYRYDLGGL